MNNSGSKIIQMNHVNVRFTIASQHRFAPKKLLKQMATAGAINARNSQDKRRKPFLLEQFIFRF